MQNEPNFQKGQMNVRSLVTMYYENTSDWTLGENEPKTNPIRTQTNPISKKAEMNTKSFMTKDYEKNRAFRLRKTNPIQTQSNPISKMNVNLLLTKDYENQPLQSGPDIFEKWIRRRTAILIWRTCATPASGAKCSPIYRCKRLLPRSGTSRSSILQVEPAGLDALCTL